MSAELDRQQVDLEKLRPVYLRAQKVIADLAMSSAALDRVLELVGMYHGDPVERAVWVLGQVKEALRPIEEARRTIRDFDSRQRSLGLLGRLEDVTR